ncbi:coiled-coil domain-containing protein 113-like isoform X2 [Macrosteles quadrilineatus]|uniref:coiled-coil domain-containing protein 113-like isoform X2 n=1 Tax=Macrosteles quadrilineatus TaxID=74068 RepID=UPI0023E0F707|nr:coiled-coil domain-containing protein 113-like isoform X2 [Macrosteles quadrilineatus]
MKFEFLTLAGPKYSNLQDLAADVESLKNNNFTFALKAEIFERYLRKRCPTLLVGVDKFSEQPSSLRMSGLFSIHTPRSSYSTSASGRSPTPSRTTSRHGHMSHSLAHSSISAYRICPLFKIDMVDRELDESRITMDKLYKRFQSAKFLLETEEENIRSDILLIEETKTAFENFVKHSVDKKTGRVFHDKFLRFVESELQNGDRDLRKLKLKTKSTQIEFNRLVAREEQRLELRERLHPIDLNKLIIENKELQENFEHKTRIVMDLKKSIGKKGQTLVSLKSKLNDVLLSIGSLRQDFKQKESKYKLTEQKEVKNVNELITAEIINHNIKKLNSNFKSPDAHSYLMLQVRLDELQSERDVWERRCKNQKQSISLLEHQLRQLSPPNKTKSKISHSYRTTRSPYSSKSADSILRRFNRTAHPIPRCTPTTPIPKNW